ncbi:MAG: hypothetical protein ACT4OS_00400 [Acidimicrobiales bacterium]
MGQLESPGPDERPLAGSAPAPERPEGFGVDRSLIDDLLDLSPAERLTRAVNDAAGLARLGV